MEATNNLPNMTFKSAYQQINFYENNRRRNIPVVTCSNGPAEFAGFFAKDSTIINNSEQSELIMCAQPFYVGEVDHNIQQIGIMAVKQVRYVNDQQWEQMLRENQNYIKAIKSQKINQIRQVRKANAGVRSRNQKGQFIRKQIPKQPVTKKKRVKKQLKNETKTQRNKKKVSNGNTELLKKASSQKIDKN